MPTIEKQMRRFACVVEALPKEPNGLAYMKEGKIKEALAELQQACPCSYWAILHDQDKEEGTENPKRPHIHLVLETKGRHTILGIVRIISAAFMIEADRVSVRECKSQPYAIRYLMHLDDSEKAPYNPFDVFTNDQGTLNLAIQSPRAELTIDDLIAAIEQSGNPVDLARRIGLANYQRYRMTINDFYGWVKKGKPDCHKRNT